MSSPQRGVYQPLMENIPIYDLSDEELEEEHSRLPLLIIIALLVLAAFAGVVWLAYNQGVARGRASAQVVIAAPAGPARTAPVDAEATTPYTGLKVYNQPIAPEQEAQASALASATLETLPQAATPAKPAATREAPPARLNPDNAKVAAAPPAAPPKPAAAAPAPSVAKPAAPAAPPVTAAVAANPAPAKPAAQTAAPAPRPAAPAVASAQPVAAASAVSGAAVLQIGAYETPEIANGAWNAFRNRFAAVAGGLSQDVQKADLGAKGTWYRLRVGPFADKTAAAAACEKLRAQGGTCFVAAP